MASHTQPGRCPAPPNTEPPSTEPPSTAAPTSPQDDPLPSSRPRRTLPTSTTILSTHTHATMPETWAAVCLTYVAAREGLADVAFWLFSSQDVVSFPLIWDGEHVAPEEPKVEQLAELLEVVCEYDELPSTLAWALTRQEHVRPLRNRLLEIMDATGTWKTEGGALAAVLAARELEMLVADLSWTEPTELLNSETVPAGVAWQPIQRLCETRLQRCLFAGGKEEARLRYVLECLRDKVEEPAERASREVG